MCITMSIYACELITNEEDANERIWQQLWKLPTLQRTKSFIWLALHDKLFTNEV